MNRDLKEAKYQLTKEADKLCAEYPEYSAIIIAGYPGTRTPNFATIKGNLDVSEVASIGSGYVLNGAQKITLIMRGNVYGKNGIAVVLYQDGLETIAMFKDSRRWKMYEYIRDDIDPFVIAEKRRKEWMLN